MCCEQLRTRFRREKRHYISSPRSNRCNNMFIVKLLLHVGTYIMFLSFDPYVCRPPQPRLPATSAVATLTCSPPYRGVFESERPDIESSLGTESYNNLNKKKSYNVVMVELNYFGYTCTIRSDRFTSTLPLSRTRISVMQYFV